ncbi:GPI mannosyltransferase 3 [Nematocida minor]|uniref:GPI mannosyltransferase 3 n=1 Tax=Nematocida minor TaxID=1912983 RepID=UPI00221F87F5|nr:GPI mannosyltransferase 3 [Nematocida minor]KAI5189440.1 GPI mannosyltransferase 3 [Nematocida minor]
MLKTLSGNSFLFPSLVAFRFINALLLKTHFEPDEYFQSVEVAMSILLKKKVFTWEWFFGIRSFPFVCLFLLPLKIFSYLSKYLERLIRIYTASPPRTSGIIFMMGAPYVVKMVMAIIAAIGDYSTIHSYILINRSTEIPREIVLVCALNLGQWLYATRSHINSFEAAISVFVFYRILNSQSITDKIAKKTDYAISVFITSLLVFVRPSSLFSLACIWGMAVIKEVGAFNLAWRKKEKIVRSWPRFFSVYLQHSRVISWSNIFTGVASIALFTAMDSLFYGELVCSPWEFYKVNITHKISHLFGTLPFVYVLFFASVLLGAYTAMLILSSFSILSAEFITPAVYTIVHGIIAHKEMRFLLPILPYLNIIIAKNLKETVAQYKLPSKKEVFGVSFKSFLKRLAFSKYVFLGNMIVAIAIGLDHQNISRPLDYLRKDCSSRLVSKDAPIFILSTFNPYMLPMNTYLGHKRIVTRCIDNNPDITSILRNTKRKKRFQDKEYRLRLLEHDTMDSCMVDNILNMGPLDYHYIVIDSKYNAELEEKVPEFVKVHESVHQRVPAQQSVSIYKQAFK